MLTSMGMGGVFITKGFDPKLSPKSRAFKLIELKCMYLFI